MATGLLTLGATVWEHPDFGETIIVYRWKHVGGGYYRWTAIGYEFDIFCPEEEQRRIIAEIEAADHPTEKSPLPSIPPELPLPWS